jgi:hypothetical protein
MNTTTFLRPADASQYLASRWGIRATVKTLAKWRVVGGGPRFRTASRDILYEEVALDAFAKARISRRDFSSTADLKAAELT